jgi:hypothetical protein
MEAAAPPLSDKVRAVRIAAANLFISIPAEMIPQRHRQAFYPLGKNSGAMYFTRPTLPMAM